MNPRQLGPAAALVGVLPAMQTVGPWTGRRQLAVRFAGEAETAVMYSAAALAEELRRLAGRASFHSITITGRDTLGNVECLQAALAQVELPLPVMAETDGQRPEAVCELAEHLELVQVTTDGTAPAAALGRIHQTLGAARDCELEHALVLLPGEHTSDAQLLRVIEQVHAVSERAAVVLHPEESPMGGAMDQRWSDLLTQAAELHGDVRLLRRLVPTTGS
ncbi:MAG TPA: hypothetical protein VGE02_01875 [Gemmatimonadales bacterium]